MWKNRLQTLFTIALICSLSFSQTLTILHTNDTHSQIDPSKDKKNPSKTIGGLVARANLIDSVRKSNKDVLLLDAGDFLQGSAYFNFFHGRLEIKAINLLKYDAITLGNHEFDNGTDSLAIILEKMEVPVICSNYEITLPSLKGQIQAYVITEKAGMRIGIIGIGVKPDGLISDKNFKGITYQDPINSANFYANKLKTEKECDLIICLSHLGIENPNVNDQILAQNSKNIDIIIGGHSHKMIDKLEVKNINGENVLITQAGSFGKYIGEIKLSKKTPVSINK